MNIRIRLGDKVSVGCPPTDLYVFRLSMRRLDTCAGVGLDVFNGLDGSVWKTQHLHDENELFVVDSIES